MPFPPLTSPPPPPSSPSALTDHKGTYISIPRIRFVKGNIVLPKCHSRKRNTEDPYRCPPTMFFLTNHKSAFIPLRRILY